MKLVIFEIRLSGHHRAYLENFINFQLQKNHEIILITSNEYNNDELVINLLRESSKFQVLFIESKKINDILHSKFGNIGREIKLWLLLRNFYHKSEKLQCCDLVFFIYFDYLLYAIGLFGNPFKNIKIIGICMRPSFHLKKINLNLLEIINDWLKKIIFNKLINSNFILNIFTIDKLLFDHFNANEKIRFLKDPVTINKQKFITEDSRLKYNLNNLNKIILIYGHIDSRKDFFKLLDTLLLYRETDNWVVIIAGIIEINIFEKIKKYNENTYLLNRIIILNQYIDDKLEVELFNLCDVVWVAYKKHYGMSGVMVMAGVFGKPIIGVNIGLISWYISEYSTGIIIDEKLSSIKNALTQLENKNITVNYGNNGYQVFINNTWDNFLRNLEIL